MFGDFGKIIEDCANQCEMPGNCEDGKASWMGPGNLRILT